MSVTGGAFIGPTTNMLDSELSWVKNHWFFFMIFLYCIPALIVEAFITKGWLQKLKVLKQRKIVLGMLTTPMLLIFWSFGLIYGSERLI